MNGRKLTVNEARPREDRGPRGGGGEVKGRRVAPVGRRNDPRLGRALAVVGEQYRLYRKQVGMLLPSRKAP